MIGRDYHLFRFAAKYFHEYTWENFVVRSDKSCGGIVTWKELELGVMDHLIPNAKFSKTCADPTPNDEVAHIKEQLAREDQFSSYDWDTFPKNRDDFEAEWAERRKLIGSKSSTFRLNKWTDRANSYFTSSEYRYDSQPYGHQLASPRRMFKLVGDRVVV
jgi:hypothetical protein